MARWKKAERKAAESFGVKRNIRVNFGEEGPDTTEHEIFSIEVKSRKKISQFLKDGLDQAQKYYPQKLPLLVVDEKYRRDQIVVMNMQDFQKLLEMMEESKSVSGLDAILEITKHDDGVSIKVK